MNDSISRLNAAQLAVAQAANELEQIRGLRIKEGVLVTLESWRDLQDALGEWRAATEAFLKTMRPEPK